jgi:hypothetical protein
VWDFLNLSGPIYNSTTGQIENGRLSDPWFYTTGLPISEPYWAKVKIANVPNMDVMIQAFERRVVTYVPDAPEGFKVQMSNIGQHYYDWRYGGAPAPVPVTPVPGTPAATTTPPAPLPSATAPTATTTPTATATATPGPQMWNHSADLLSNRTIYHLRLTGPGEIRARASWSGAQGTLALIINGPGQTSYYARQDGGSPLQVSYTVTDADFATGDTWRVTVASFGTDRADGNIEITYPSGSPTVPFTNDFVVQPESGSEVSVIVLRGPGAITGQATWSGTPANLALLINGPGQVGYYARQDGPSGLVVNYVVTPDDYAAGSNWVVRLVSFAANTNTTGQINIIHP